MNWPERMERPPDDERRRAAVRAWAEWNLGDGTWGSTLVSIYMDPGPYMRKLEEDKQS